MKNLMKAFVLPALLFAGVAQSWAGTLSGTVADYNAAQVRLSDGVLTVPASLVTYTATATIPIGTTFNVTLPTGFSFTSSPTLTSTSATFTLVGTSGAQASFTVAGSSVTSGQTIVLGGYNVQGATALEKITPPAIALPISMQAVGIDAHLITFPEFASDSGIQAVFVGAIQFIDLSPPSNGTKFYSSPDTPTAVLSAIAIEPETVDFATSTIPILGTNGETNTLNSSDTATIMIPGLLYGGLKSVFPSNVSTCASAINETSYVFQNYLVFVDIPLNKEIFFCVTGNGQPIKLFASPTGETTYGFNTILVTPNYGVEADFTSTTNVSIEFSGDFCYTYSASGLDFNNCVGQYYNQVLAPRE
jgi:hypothetical protein